jgi:primosomal protein N' (replication factor Y)
MLGAGTQRVQEDLEDLLGTRALRIDHDISSKKTELKSLAENASEADGRVVIGTKLMTGRLAFSGKFSMAAVLNADLFMNIPDFRSPEKAYQEISSVIDMLDPGGEIFIQTRMPQNYLYRCLKNYDYLSFVKEENQRRKELNYPPYSRLLLIKFTSKRELSKELSDISGKIAGDIQILGPYAAKNKSGGNEFKLLLKSAVRGSLHAAAKIFLKAFKNVKEVKIRIDVDPITI